MLQRLTDEHLGQLHTASIELMEKTGVRLLHKDAVDLLRENGCVVSENTVCFPPELVEWALEVAPKEITIFNQKGQPAMRLNGRCAYYGNGSDLLYIIDHNTGQRRISVLEDVKDMIKIMKRITFHGFCDERFYPCRRATRTSSEVPDADHA